MPDKQGLFNSFSNNKDIDEIIKMLSSIKALPETVYTTFKDPSQNGEWDPNTNTIYLNKNDKNPDNTYAHEFSHVLNDAMDKSFISLRAKVYQGEKLTPEESKFVLGYAKLKPSTSNVIPGAWLDPNYEAYRLSNREVPAFAIGNMASPQKAKAAAAPHFDATIAQEQAILRDLYARQQQPATPWWKDPFGFSIK
jgi:hypothetical protein